MNKPLRTLPPVEFVTNGTSLFLERKQSTNPDGNPYLVSPYSTQQRLFIYTLTAAWMFALLSFYCWWFDPSHVVTTIRFWVITLALFWVTLLPAYFFFFVLRARVPNPNLKIPSGWRVAMVVTKVPSEPLSMVQQTIRGMLS